jgi:hypothetical protein
LLEGYALSNAGWSGLDGASGTVSEDVATRTERLSGQFMMITESDEPASHQAEFKYEVQRESDGIILSILYTPSGDGRHRYLAGPVAKEPIITRLDRTQSQAGDVGDPNQIYLNGVDAKLSDDRVVHLFSYHPGALDLPDNELIGLTVAQAVTLAKSCGTIDDTDAGRPYE